MGGGLLGLKGLFAAADLAVVALLARAGGRRGGFAAALYAFHPLPITESAGQGHLDSLGVALLLAAMAHLRRRGAVRAGVAFALSVLAKYVSFGCVLPLLRRGGGRFALASLLCGTAIWTLASRPGASPAGGFGDYATRWEFNSLVYPSAVALVEAARLPEQAKARFLDLKQRLNHPNWTQAVFPFFYAGFFARTLLALTLAAALVAIACRFRRLETAVFASLAALLIASPTLQPWYLLWVLPFAANRREPAFLFLSFSVPASYALLFPIAGVGRPAIYAIEYVPFAILLAVTLGKAGLARRGRARALA